MIDEIIPQYVLSKKYYTDTILTFDEKVENIKIAISNELHHYDALKEKKKYDNYVKRKQKSCI